jgi:hypothetical protein
MAAPAILPFSPDGAATPTLDVPGTTIVDYIKRHWRGDLSLPFSYWINGWLLGIGYIVGTVPVIEHPNSSIAYVIGCLIVMALGIAIQVWQLIGIWRSACKHTERGGRKIWATLAQVGVILGWLNFLRGTFELLGVPGN